MSFALGSPVGDVAWSPFSATIFAAVTEDGLARVFDLSRNATEPLCEQRLTAKAGLTRIAFNPQLDVILVGDDRSAQTDSCIIHTAVSQVICILPVLQGDEQSKYASA